MIERAFDLNGNRNPDNSPLMVMADSEGRIFEHPELLMLGAEGRNHRLPMDDEVIQVPRGADFFVLPGRHPVGVDPQSGSREVVRTFQGQPVFAVSVDGARLSSRAGAGRSPERPFSPDLAGRLSERGLDRTPAPLRGLSA